MTSRLTACIRDDLTTGQVGLICGVSPQTVINWCILGRLTWKRIGRGPRRIPKSEVRLLLEKNNMPVPEALNKDAA